MRVITLIKQLGLGISLLFLAGVAHAVESIDDMTIRVIESDDANMANELTLPFDVHETKNKVSTEHEVKSKESDELAGSSQEREEDAVSSDNKDRLDDRNETKEDHEEAKEEHEIESEVPEPEEPSIEP